MTWLAHSTKAAVAGGRLRPLRTWMPSLPMMGRPCVDSSGMNFAAGDAADAVAGSSKALHQFDRGGAHHGLGWFGQGVEFALDEGVGGQVLGAENQGPGRALRQRHAAFAGQRMAGGDQSSQAELPAGRMLQVFVLGHVESHAHVRAAIGHVFGNMARAG